MVCTSVHIYIMCIINKYNNIIEYYNIYEYIGTFLIEMKLIMIVMIKVKYFLH